MRTKVTLVLLFLNVVVFFFIFHFERNWRTERVALEVRHRVLGAEAADIRSLDVESAAPGGSFSLERRDDGWFLTKPVEWRANPLAVNRIISDLQFLEDKTSFSVSDVEKNGQSLADYGLDKPRLTVTFASGGMDTTGRPAVTTTLRIGSATRFGDRLYLLSSGGDRIHVVDRSLAASFTVAPDELRDDAVLTVPVFEARSLNIQTAPPEDLHIRIHRDGGRWSFETPILARADRNAIELTINRLDELRVKAFVPDNPAVPLPSASPVLTVTIEGDNRHETLYVGPPSPREGGALAGGASASGEYYAQLEGRSALFVTVISDGLMTALRDAQDILRDRHVLDFDARSVTGITLEAPDQPDLALRRDAPGEAGEEPRWQIVFRGGAGQGPSTLPADTAAVHRLLEQLAQLSAVRFQSDAPQASELENWGFNRPERVVALTLAGPRSGSETPPAEGSQILLQIGLPAPRGTIAYARVTNAPYVYAVNPDILAETDVAPGAWRERLLRAAPPGAKIEELKLMDLKTGKLILDWKPGAVLPPDREAAVQAAIVSLRTLRARKFLLNSFSDQVVVGGAAQPWTYRLDATIALPGGAGTVQTGVSTLWLAERTGGGEQAAGSKEFNAEFLIEQPLLDALWTLTYGSGERPPPGEP